MRNRIRLWLIRLANKIGDGSYYDFGEPIENGVTVGGKLVVFTKNSCYAWDGKEKWIKITVGLNS